MLDIYLSNQSHSSSKNLTRTFSQMNTMIDITLPIPRNINAGNKN